MNAEIIATIVQTLNKNKRVALIRIIDRKGSAPRAIGSACLVDESGCIAGSVGGGFLEYRAVEMAKEKLLQNFSTSYRFSLSQKEIAEEGMICGGDVELYIEPLVPGNEPCVQVFSAMHEILAGGAECTLVTRKVGADNDVRTEARMVFANGERVLGNIPGVTLPAVILSTCGEHFAILATTDGERSCIYERILPKPQVVIFGAGHIGRALAILAKNVDFKVVIVDDRRDFANTARLPMADELYHVPYGEALQVKPLTVSSYAIVVTKSHKSDREVLELLLNSNVIPAYIGMIGSIRKRKIIYNELLATGINPARLEKIHSPIGLDIQAETPAELAVSIIAEIIKVKNGNQG